MAPPAHQPADALDPELTAQVTTQAAAAGLQGWLLIARGDRVVVSRGVGTIAPDSRRGFAEDQRWTLASFTKQVLAVLLMQAAARGELDLDQPVATYLPGFASANASRVTVRHLLRHQSGFPNPDATPAAANGVPSFYAAAEPAPDALRFCGGATTGPGGDAWAYNNCDYLVAVEVLERVTGTAWEAHVAALNHALGTSFSIHGARLPGYEGAASDLGLFDMSRYKGAGDLSGSVRDVLAFDRALLAGTLVTADARAQMWNGQPSLGYIALGQWAFPVTAASCARTVTLIERRGAMGYVELRNVLVPELDLVIITLTNRAGVDFGEPWSGAGLTYELLAATVCNT